MEENLGKWPTFNDTKINENAVSDNEENIIDDSDEDSDEDSITSLNEVVISEDDTSKKTTALQDIISVVADSDEEEDDDNLYLQKLERDVNKNYLEEFHPESISHNYEEIRKMTMVVRNAEGIIIDELHKTVPFLTKYEYTRVLGQRAKQLNSGALPFVRVAPNILDGYVIAEQELLEKKLPFIIQRPIPGGGIEYWHLNDLEILGH